MIVRDRASDNLRCPARALVDQHNKRRLGQSIFGICLQKFLFEFLSLQITDRSGIEEQVCKFHCFRFFPAGAVSKIQNDVRRAFLQERIKLFPRFLSFARCKIWNFQIGNVVFDQLAFDRGRGSNFPIHGDRFGLRLPPFDDGESDGLRHRIRENFIDLDDVHFSSRDAVDRLNHVSRTELGIRGRSARNHCDNDRIAEPLGDNSSYSGSFIWTVRLVECNFLGREVPGIGINVFQQPTDCSVDGISYRGFVDIIVLDSAQNLHENRQLLVRSILGADAT